MLVLTFSSHVMPLESFAADSTNYHLSTFAMDSAGAGVTGTTYDMNHHTMGEPVNGEAESVNKKLKAGYLYTIVRDETNPPPPPAGTDYEAESVNFKQISHLLCAGSLSSLSANYEIPLALTGEPIGGVLGGHYTGCYGGYLYTLLGNAPILSQNIPPHIWPENTSNHSAFDLDDYFYDPDSDMSAFSVSGSADITVDIDPVTHIVSFSQGAGYTGQESIVITAIDDEGNRTPSNPITLNVYDTGGAINNAPVLSYLADITVKEGNLITIEPYAVDPDGDPVTYSFDAPFDASGKWQTDHHSAGTYNITVTASDGLLSDGQVVDVTVLDVNRGPALDHIADITGPENQLITITPTATDPDNDDLTYFFTTPFNDLGQWLPTYHNEGIHSVTVTVSDGELSASQDVTINITDVNSMPVVDISLECINAPVDQDVTFIVTASDVDDDTLTLTLKKDGSDFYTGGIYDFHIGRTSFSSLGTHTITAIVDDDHTGQAQVTTNIEIIDPPALWNKILPLLGDFNGDALVDIGTYNRDSGRWAVALSNLSGFGSVTEWLSGFGASTDWHYVNGDFNGDGKTDIAVFNQSNGEWRVGISDGAQFSDEGLWSTFTGALTSSIPMAGDFTGDGVSDVGIYNRSNGNVTVASSDKSSFGTPSTWISGLPHSSTAQPFSGDFNGDGLIDMGVFNDGNWNFAVNNGTGFVAKGVWNFSFGTDNAPVISDFNNDGLTDIGIVDKETGNWSIYHCTGDGFVSKGDWLTGFGQGESNTFYGLDFNGDRLTDAAVFHNTDFTWERSTAQGAVADNLERITNSLNGTTEISYRSSVYYDNTGDDDECDLPFAILTVSKVKQGDGMGNFYETRYSYANGLYDSDNRENRGFGYVKVTDAEGNIAENWFNQDNIYKGLPAKEQASDSQGNLYTKTVKSYEYTTPYTGCIFAYLTEEETSVYEGQITPKVTAVTYEYDSYGNPRKVRNLGDIAITGDEKESNVEYVYNTGLWILGLPSYTYSKNAQDEIVGQSWLYYDYHDNYTDIPVKGDLTKEEAWLDTPGKSNPVTHTTYDEYGNVLTTTDARGKVCTTAYDFATHTYPETVSNHLGHTVTNTYDFRTSQVLTSIDVNGHTNKNRYDVFGRVEEVFGPYDDIMHPSTWYEYDLLTTPAKITVYVREEYNTDDPAKIRISYSFVDGLGRTIQTKTEANDPLKQILSGITVFNSRGLMADKYLPYYVDATATYTVPNFEQPKATYKYDCLGKLIKRTNPDLTYATVDYGPGVITNTSENGHLIRKHQDAYGQTLRVEEFNHGRIYVTQYEYDAQGNLLKITDDANNIIRIDYDSLGRKTSMDDPDMGHWEYDYDENGNLISQTDAKGQVLTFEYDDLNRLKYKKANAQTIVTHIYDEAGKDNCIGLLSSVTDQSGGTEFFYDDMGREDKSVKTVDGISYTVERGYDAMDRLKTVTYPDGEVVTYTYATSGGIKTIAGDEIYVSDIAYNVYGQRITVNYGNGTHMDYDYDPLTLKLEHLTTNDGALQDLQYGFDNVGNIITINDALHSATQSFGYDDLDRLTSAIGQTYGTKTYRYNSIGNIMEKDGVNFTYGENGVGPHAVTSGDNGLRMAYDANGNMVSKDYNGYVKNFEYDIQNRLVEVSMSKGEEYMPAYEFQLQAGWNYLSLPIILDQIVSLSTDKIQVSRYNSQTQAWEHFVQEAGMDLSRYNDFTALEYCRGYEVYVETDCTFVISGNTSSAAQQMTLTAGQWNLIGAPTTFKPMPVEEALAGLTYTRVVYYNGSTYEDVTEMESGKAYFVLLDPGSAETWNIPNQQENIKYVYDGDGGKVVKYNEGETVTYIGSVYEVQTTVADVRNKKHIFMGSTRVCTIEYDQAVPGETAHYYFHQDHLGSSNVITNDDGAMVQLMEYQPYGQLQVNSGNEIARHKFTGKEFDENVGLYYYGARYYDPQLGRFITSDSIIQSPHDPQSLNRYAYCRNNPVKYVDPTGHFFGIIIAAIIGAILGGVSAAMNDQPIWKGIIVGAVGGALAGAGGSFFHFWGAVAGGAMAGTINSAAFGGNIGIGALTGGVGGGLGYGLGSWASGWRSGSFWGGLGAATTSGAIAGGIGAELQGGEFGKGAGMGAAYGSAGYLGTVGLRQFNSRYKTAEGYEQESKKRHDLNAQKGDKIKLTVISREVMLSGRHLAILDNTPFRMPYEMGPGETSGLILTTRTSKLALEGWRTPNHTQSALKAGLVRVTTVEVSASGLVEAIALYEKHWTGTSYNWASYNSNYAVNSIIYSAGGDVPGGLGYVPPFGTTPYIPTAYK